MATLFWLHLLYCRQELLSQGWLKKRILQFNKLASSARNWWGFTIHILDILLLFHHFMLRLVLLLSSASSFNISYGCETLIEWKSLLLVGAAETWRQQKSWWSVIYRCHINRLTWPNHGLSHEEDLRICRIWFHHRFLLCSWLFKQLWWKLK